MDWCIWVLTKRHRSFRGAVGKIVTENEDTLKAVANKEQELSWLKQGRGWAMLSVKSPVDKLVPSQYYEIMKNIQVKTSPSW